MKTPSFAALERRYSARNYSPLDVVLSHAAGALAWDTAGRRYIDMMSAYSSASLGHGHPAILKVLAAQAQRLDVTSRAFFNDRLPLWFERMAEVTGFPRIIPMNTGAEAVDTALKVARKWGETVKGIARDQTEVIAVEGNFHGRTFGAISLSTEPQYRAHFGPLLGGVTTVPFNDLSALACAIGPNTAAFIVEPIQGEAGIRVPSPGYLAEAQRLCERNNVLLKRTIFATDEHR